MKNLKNSIQLIGNLGMNPEVKIFDNGKKLTTLSIATSEKYINAKGEKTEDTQWHRVIAWGKLADIMAAYLTKGSPVAIDGKVVYKNYEDKSGNKKYITEIIASGMTLLPKKESNN